MKTKATLLQELYEPYKKCAACPLGSLGRTTVVFGSGNPEAQIMFIGEAPGQEEDRLGKPFVGKSGQLLTKILSILDIERSDVYISNIVKCRPPNNRKPTLTESNICKKILLLKQIEIIKPKVLCTLGATALEGLIDEPVKMTRMRGIPIKHPLGTIIPTFHPAYILRNNSQLEKMILDIQYAKSITQGMPVVSGG